MPDTTRTFVAVAVPSALEPRLVKLQEKLAVAVPEGRWETPRPFHITLAFLGDVGHGELNDVCLAVAGVADAFDRFELELGGVGGFPTASQPRVVWVGVVGPGLDPLVQLQGQVAAAVTRLGYRPDARPFHPHVTLGRFGHGRRPRHDLTPVLNQYNSRHPWGAGPFAVTEAITYGSSVGREGPDYAALGRARLKGRKPGTSP